MVPVAFGFVRWDGCVLAVGGGTKYEGNLTLPTGPNQKWKVSMGPFATCNASWMILQYWTR